MILLMLAALAASVGCSKRADEGPLAARVGDEGITQAALDERFQKELALVSYHRKPDAQQAQQIRQKALDALVEDNLLFLEARRRKLMAGPHDVDGRIEQMAQSYGGEDKLEEMLRQQGRSLEGLRHEMEKQVLAQVLLDDLVEPPSEQDREEAKAYYEGHQERYVLPPAAHLRRALVKIDPGDLKASWERATKRADEILKAWRAGGDFDALAANFPQDEFKDLGWVHEGSLIPELEEAARALTPGGISPPVKTFYGWQILQLIETQPPKQLSFEEVAESVVAQRAEEKREKAKEQLLAESRERWPVEILDGGTQPQ